MSAVKGAIAVSLMLAFMWAGMVAVVLLFAAAASFVLAGVAWLLWNEILSPELGWRHLPFWSAWVVLLAATVGLGFLSGPRGKR